MFWGCISKHGAGPIVALKGNQKGIDYLQTIKEQNIPEIQEAQQLYHGS